MKWETEYGTVVEVPKHKWVPCTWKPITRRIKMAKGSALKKELKCSSELREFLKGAKTISRGELMKKIWSYAKRHDLQLEDNKRVLRIEGSRLEPLFSSKLLKKHTVTMRGKTIKVPEGCVFMTEIGGAMTEHLG